MCVLGSMSRHLALCSPTIQIDHGDDQMKAPPILGRHGELSCIYTYFRKSCSVLLKALQMLSAHGRAGGRTKNLLSTVILKWYHCYKFLCRPGVTSPCPLITSPRGAESTQLRPHAHLRPKLQNNINKYTVLQQTSLVPCDLEHRSSSNALTRAC